MIIGGPLRAHLTLPPPEVEMWADALEVRWRTPAPSGHGVTGLINAVTTAYAVRGDAMP